MSSFSVFLFLFSILSIASVYDARVMKDDPVPNKFSRDFDTQPNLSMFKEDFNPNPHHDTPSQSQKDEFLRDFDAQPNLKMFSKDFNPNPHHDAPSQPKKEQFLKEFENQPNLNMFSKDFNPYPNPEAPPLKN